MQVALQVVNPSETVTQANKCTRKVIIPNCLPEKYYLQFTDTPECVSRGRRMEIDGKHGRNFRTVLAIAFSGYLRRCSQQVLVHPFVFAPDDCPHIS